MSFTHYYKIRVYVNNGMERYKTWKYVFADNKQAAIETVLEYYNSQYDTHAKICEIHTYPVQDAMIFGELMAIK